MILLFGIYYCVNFAMDGLIMGEDTGKYRHLFKKITYATDEKNNSCF